MNKKHLLLMEMASVVPRSAQGYVSDLENGSEKVIEDRLQMLERHCPDLVARFRELPSIGGKRDGAGRPAPTIRNLQARIIYAQHDGNHAEVLRLKKELENLK
jgi:hypothetical protein